MTAIQFKAIESRLERIESKLDSLAPRQRAPKANPGLPPLVSILERSEDKALVYSEFLKAASESGWSEWGFRRELRHLTGNRTFHVRESLGKKVFVLPAGKE